MYFVFYLDVCAMFPNKICIIISKKCVFETNTTLVKVLNNYKEGETSNFSTLLLYFEILLGLYFSRNCNELCWAQWLCCFQCVTPIQRTFYFKFTKESLFLIKSKVLNSFFYNFQKLKAKKWQITNIYVCILLVCRFRIWSN